MRSLWWVGLGFSLQGWATPAPTVDSIAAYSKKLYREAVKEHRPFGLDEFIEALGEQHPELRDNYVLMHGTKSRQEASYEFPRVIAHTADGRFTLAFSTDPEAEAYNELEMYDFGKKPVAAKPPGVPEGYQAEGFRFRRIVFGRKGPKPQPINEALCVDCHGKEPRPNWESYNLWEGAYPDRDGISTGEKYYLGYQTADHAGFDLFYTNQAGKGRFRFLQKLEEQFLVDHGKRGIPPRIAPSDYTQRVGYLNYRRIAHLLLASPEFQKYKYAIFGALYDCDHYDTFFPTPLTTPRSLAWYIEDTEKRFAADANRYHLRGDHPSIGKFRYVMEGRGISLAKWSLSFRRSAYAFVTPGGMPEGFISAILLEYDKSLEPYRFANLVQDNGYGGYGVTTEFSQKWTGSMKAQTSYVCGLLEAKSREALVSH